MALMRAERRSERPEEMDGNPSEFQCDMFTRSPARAGRRHRGRRQGHPPRRHPRSPDPHRHRRGRGTQDSFRTQLRRTDHGPGVCSC